ncbi:MAG: SDR family NAD(P)-dependent oxidoreductase [Bacteroidales bacterium]|nr:SDR family NAD(P)-dependent oxidoreductase [Bacteroidales bacterium]
MKNDNPYVLILGGSGSIGLACAKELSLRNYNLVIVHRDSRSANKYAQHEFEVIRESGTILYDINANINAEDTFEKLLNILKVNNINRLHAFIHASADANLGNILNPNSELSHDDFIHTLNSMSISFVVWAKGLIEKRLLSENSKVVGFTSEGSSKVLKKYVAVGMAKSALEAACRYMAIEFAPLKINVNLINAGIIMSRSVNILDKHNDFINEAIIRNPSGRLTKPEDVSKVMAFLLSDDSNWITGQIITVDGGEQLVAI